MAYSRIFKDCNPNSRTFQGLELSFANFQVFPGFSRTVAAMLSKEYSCTSRAVAKSGREGK